ncbi:6-phosphogluconolactonase [Chlorobaculum limnaeum]|uniref:6-phosphogluconolactonase n=1 Tax=Chlorobaculum limnaeum TaxID=274537 RepID=A0A1D8CZU6_CHLLM|nr:6-phosphogluconolactonase [Chlorobaculum limnaeum]AOS84466.1 6-phosphogluconolactonase [Chlorobaculum limnaeum]
MTHWITAPLDALLEKAVAFITDAAYRAVAERGRFTLVLSGGNTPRALHKQLARGISEKRYLELGYKLPADVRRCTRDPEKIVPPWAHTLLFQGDERYVPPSHPDSNYGMARETLLRQVCVKPANIHRMPTESGNPAEDARRYESLLRGLFRKRGSDETAPPSFDLILLGLGDDGHTASLMPGDRKALDEKEHWVIAVNAPNGKPPGTRLTLTLPVINEAANVLFLIPSSRYDLARSISNSEKPELPAGMVKPWRGDVWWFVEGEGRIQP